jgi:hypothetical protein
MQYEFPSKRDGWLVAVLWLSALLLIGSVPLVLRVHELGGLRIPLATVHAVGALLPLWVLYSTSYRVGRYELHVRSGPFRWSIPLDAVRSVSPTQSALSSPACSLDRLRVAYRGSRRERAILLSPADKSAFLGALAEACPRLVPAEDGLRPPH